MGRGFEEILNFREGPDIGGNIEISNGPNIVPRDGRPDISVHP